MSIAQHIALAARKERLLERIAAQRSELVVHVEPLKQPLALVDKLVQAANFVKQRPWIAGVAAIATVIIGRGGVLRWVGRGWTVWRGWRFASRWLQDHGYLKIQ